MMTTSRRNGERLLALLAGTLLIILILITDDIIMLPGQQPGSARGWTPPYRIGLWGILLATGVPVMYRRYFMHRMRVRIRERDLPEQPWQSAAPDGRVLVPGRFRRVRAQARTRAVSHRRRLNLRDWQI